MLISNIFPLFAYFSKTIDFGTVLGAEMNSACKNTLITKISYDLKTTAIYRLIFAKAIA